MTFTHTPMPGNSAAEARAAGLFGGRGGPPVVPKAGPVQTFTNYNGSTVLNRLDPSISRFPPLLRYPLAIPQGLNTWVVIGYALPGYPPFVNPTSLPFSWQVVTVDPITKATTVGRLRSQAISSSAPATLGAIGNDGSFLVTDGTDQTITAVWFNSDYTALVTSTISPTLAPAQLVPWQNFVGYNVNGTYNIAYVSKNLAICAVGACPSYPSGALVSVSPLAGTLSTLQLSTILTSGPNPFISIALFDATHILLVYGDGGPAVNFYLVPFDPGSGSLGTPVLHVNGSPSAVPVTGGYSSSRHFGGGAPDRPWYLGQPRAYTPSGYVDDHFDGHTGSSARSFYTDNSETLGLGGGGVGGLDPSLSQVFSAWSLGFGYADRGTGTTFVAPGYDSGSTDTACEYVGAPYPQAVQPLYVVTDNDLISRSNGWVLVDSDGQAQTTTVLDVRYVAPGDANILADPHVDNHIFWSATTDPSGAPISDGTYGTDGFWGGRGTVDPAGTPLWVVPSFTSGYYVTAGQQRTVATDTYTGAIFSTNSMFQNANLDYGSYPGCTWGFSLPNASIHNSDLSHGSFEQDCFSYTEASYCNFTNSLMGNDGNFEAFASDFTGSDFTDAKFSVPGNTATTVEWCDFTDAILRNCDMRHVAFSQCSFIGANMTGAVFDGSTTFTGCLFDVTTIWPSGFNPATISGGVHAFADYSNQTLTGTDLSGVFLGHANFENAVLTNVNLGRDYVGWANFKGAKLLGSSSNSLSLVAAPWTDFTNATIDFGSTRSRSGVAAIDTTNWAHANFQNAQFTFGGVVAGVSVPAGTPVIIDAGFGCAAYCNFNGIQNPPGYPLFFANGNFSYSTFVGARLYDSTALPQCATSGASVSALMAYCDFTNIQGGWFEACNLTGSTFRGASLPVSCFTNANLCDVDFTGATVTPAAFDVTVTGNFYLSQIGGGPRTRPGSTVDYDMKATYNTNTIRPHGIATSMLLLANTDISSGNDAYSSLTTAFAYFKNKTVTYLDGRWGENDDGRNRWQMMVYYGSCPGMVFTPSIYGFHNFQDGFATDFRGAELMGSIWDNWTASSLYMCNLGFPATGVSVPRGKSVGIAGPRAARQPAVVLTHSSSTKAQSS